MVTLPPPVFLGFIAKKFHPVTPEEWDGAEEICSVSKCIAPYPEGWDDNPFDPPSFNRAYCLTTVDDAWNRVAETEKASSRVFALRLIPAVFAESLSPTLYTADEYFNSLASLPSLPDEPDLSAFERIGFDVNAKTPRENSVCWGWSCSPLSCNGMHQEFAVNRYCLIDQLDDAVKVAQSFSQTEPEPGPYVIVEVFRLRREFDRA